MGIAQVHDQVFALLLHTVANTLNVQGLGIAFRHAYHHIVDERAGQAVERTGLLFVVRTGNQNFIAFHRNAHLGVKGLVQGALGALYRHFVAVDFHFNASGNIDGFSSNSRHALAPPFLTR